MFTVRNLKEPLILENWQCDGFSLNAAREGQIVNLCCLTEMTSDEASFHAVVLSLASYISSLGREQGHSIDIQKYNDVLIVIDKDNNARLWIESAAKSANAIVKRDIAAFEPIFRNDVADLLEINFPAIDFDKNDRIIYLFREAWRFGVYLDLRKEVNRDLKQHWRSIASLERQMVYYDLYAALGNQKTLDRLIDLGWFPFAEIIGREFNSILNALLADWDIASEEQTLISSFGSDRVQHLFDRWMRNELVCEKRLILRSAIDAYLRNDYVSTIKVLITEIEGIINILARKNTGKTLKTRKVANFLADQATEKVGSHYSLLFAKPFQKFLEQRVFANRRPDVKSEASSRHEVSHGDAGSESYTQAIALQLILTIDQIVFSF